jgi:xanthosine utilization system XapX-like protein
MGRISMIKLGLGLMIGASAGLLSAQRGLSSALTIVAAVGLFIGLALIFWWAKDIERGNKEESS